MAEDLRALDIDQSILLIAADQPMSPVDSARELTTEELTLIGGGWTVPIDWGTVGQDIKTSMQGAAYPATVMGVLGMVAGGVPGAVSLNSATELGAGAAGLGYGLVHGWYVHLTGRGR